MQTVFEVLGPMVSFNKTKVKVFFFILLYIEYNIQCTQVLTND